MQARVVGISPGEANTVLLWLPLLHRYYNEPSAIKAIDLSKRHRMVELMNEVNTYGEHVGESLLWLLSPYYSCTSPLLQAYYLLCHRLIAMPVSVHQLVRSYGTVAMQCTISTTVFYSCGVLMYLSSMVSKSFTAVVLL
eukprot:GHUV01024588.1.p2 GENE.GHUV01024588.1~~GHUV01024588.1.p2  ORF type:complete len:139 (+),score=23.65 GHUV01024588.1:1271-1687(+)